MSSTSLREAVDVSHGEIQSCKPQGSGRSSAEEAHRQAQWQKQIDYGKNTLGYAHYLKLIPKEKRRREHPTTPDIMQSDISKKRFDGQVRTWRRALHKYDEIAQEALKKGLEKPASLSSEGGKKRIHEQAFDKFNGDQRKLSRSNNNNNKENRHRSDQRAPLPRNDNGGIPSDKTNHLPKVLTLSKGEPSEEVPGELSVFEEIMNEFSAVPSWMEDEEDDDIQL